MNHPSVFALIDCNNFFVSCERVFRPDLVDKPVIVLSSNDGCAVSRSNEAKQLGIPMGAPWFLYKEALAPYGVQVFSGNFGLYRDLSARVQAIIRCETDQYELYSIDESFIEISNRDISDYEAWAQDLRTRIYRWTGIPVAIGIGSTKTLAKIAVWHAKHCRLPREKQGSQSPCEACRGAVHPYVCDMSDTAPETSRWQSLLQAVPISDVWGIGRQLTKKLTGQRVTDAYRLAMGTEVWQRQNFNVIGRRTVRELHGEACFWLDQDVRGLQKSIMVTRSFGKAIYDENDLIAAVVKFASRASEQLREKGEIAQHLIVFMRTHLPHQTDRPTYRASSTVRLERSTDDTLCIAKAAAQIVHDLYKSEYAYKKAGVILYNLLPKSAQQLQITDVGLALHTLDNRDALMHGVDTLAERYGERVVRVGSELLSAKWHSRSEQKSPITMQDWQHIPIVTV